MFSNDRRALSIYKGQREEIEHVENYRMVSEVQGGG